MGSQKIGFWSVVSIVLGSQIGSGIFIMPSALAPYGSLGVYSWLLTGLGAVFLALIFGELCHHFPQTGGPHVYVHHAFGRSIAYFMAWAYWVISWVSSSAVVIAAVGYFAALFGGFPTSLNLGLQIIVLFLFMAINLRGVLFSGQAEFIFTLLKVIPLGILPLAALPLVDWSNFSAFNPSSLPLPTAMGTAILLTFWGFIGVETATTPAGSVENARRVIPRAIVLGTIGVALIYFLANFGIFGVMGADALQQTQAPFVDAAQRIFGGNWHVGIALCGTIVCLGTLNAWILTSGQIALGAAQDHLFPAFFKKKNTHQAPHWGIIISTLGVIPILVLSLSDDLNQQLTRIIDASVTAFVVIYLACILSFLKLAFQKKIRTQGFYIAAAILALGFCAWVLWGAGIRLVALSSLAFLTGIPVYLRQKKYWESHETT